ncbi:MAG: TlpA family protein disulfide reductase [Bacteroidales bacterium]|nr:TlpA family protein disulfide reductase [Bacteroidales bacterium]
MNRIRFILCVAAVLAVTACTKYQVSGILEGGAEQLAVIQLGGGGFERIDTLDCLVGAFAFDVDYDKPVSIIITDLARQGLQTGKCVRLMTVPGEHAIVSGSLDNYTITGTQFYQDQAAYNESVAPLGKNIVKISEVALSFVREHPSSVFSATIIGDCLDYAPEALDLLDSSVKDGVMKPLIATQLKVLEARQNILTAADRIYPGAEAPDFTLPTPNDRTMSLYNVQDGKYILLDFWGSWCPNCIKGLPKLEELYARYNDRLSILSIDCDETKSEWLDAIARYGMPWYHVINNGDVDVAALYGVTGYPTKILIGPDGRILKIFVGEGQELYNYFDRLFH